MRAPKVYRITPLLVLLGLCQLLHTDVVHLPYDHHSNRQFYCAILNVPPSASLSCNNNKIKSEYKLSMYELFDTYNILCIFNKKFNYQL